jgi:predicted MFS family arabinose efflux permease
VNQQLSVRRHGANPLAWVRRRLAGAIGNPARRRVVLLFAAVLALDSADKATLGAVAAELKPDLHIGNPQLGLLAGATAAVSAMATVPMGVLTDRVTRVRLLAGSVALWAGAMGWSALAGSFDTLLLSRLALGAVLATAGPVIASLVGDFFAPEERGRIYGYILSGDLIGSGFGFLVSGNVAAALSWRFSFGLLAVAALPLAWMLHKRLKEPARGGADRLIREGDEEAGETGLAERVVRGDDVKPIESLVLNEDPSRMPLPRALRYVLSVRTNVVLIIATAAGYFFFAGLRTFGVVFARGHFGLSQSVASTLFVLVGIGALLGTLVGGRLADSLMRRGHVNARLLVGIAGFVAAALLLLPGLLAGTLILALPLYLLGAAAFSLPNPPLDAARLDVMPSQLWGRAEGLRTFVRTCAEAGAPLLFGIVAGALGGNGSAHHSRGIMYAFLIGLAPLALNGLILARGLKSYPRDVATASESNARIRRAAA